MRGCVCMCLRACICAYAHTQILPAERGSTNFNNERLYICIERERTNLQPSFEGMCRYGTCADLSLASDTLSRAERSPLGIPEF